MTIDPRELRHCFGSFMTGVTVVTTKDKNGKPIGFTANSFSSVSLDPPLLLICIDNNSDNFDTFTEGNAFAVNVLASDQEALSNRFSSPITDRFEGQDWENSGNNNPIFAGTAAHFDCRLENTISAGDHTIMIGRVENCASSGQAGLGYSRGQYFTLDQNN